MPKQNVYARAARTMERAPSSIYPCKHICDAAGVSFYADVGHPGWPAVPEVQQFLAAFCETGDDLEDALAAAHARSDEFIFQTNIERDVCVLALCFAAAMLEASCEDAAALREAARLVEQNSDTINRSCWALKLAQGLKKCDDSELADRYVDVMLDGQTCTMYLPWADEDDGSDNIGDREEDHDVRVLLLCFAAAMAETGDL